MHLTTLAAMAILAMQDPPGPWEKSYEDALAAAKKSGKLVMLDFWFDG